MLRLLLLKGRNQEEFFPLVSYEMKKNPKISSKSWIFQREEPFVETENGNWPV